MVGERPPGTRAHEARPPAAPVPRQVHPAARRSAARPLPRAGRARPRSVRRLRDDARAGARVGTRRDRRRAGRVQLPARPGEDRAVRRRRARRGASRRLRAARLARARSRGSSTRALSARVVRAEGSRGAARLPRPRRGFAAPGCAAGDPLAGGALGAQGRALRPRGAAGGADGGVLVPQAPPDVPAGRVGGLLPAAVHARHAAAHRGVRSGSRLRAGGAGASRGRAGRRVRGDVRRDPHLAALSGTDRLPRAAPLRLRAARSRRPA